jgi:GNAT superfamily N-acetyltransferase
LDNVRIEVATVHDVLRFVTVPEDREFFLARLRRGGRRRGHVFIAFAGDRPVGYVYLRLESAEELKLRLLLTGTPLIERLRVVPEFRHKGVGRLLVARAEEGARLDHRRRIALGVDESRPDPIAFYLRLGYAEWSHGRVRTFKEAGRRREIEYCRVFVKKLGPPDQ